jgi:3-hydroxyisobutyrate dehydrogenase-like beta-hydroxyacid dehydrogenase
MGDKASQANVMKVAVNFMIASAIESMAEASVLVGAYGLESGQLIDLISSSIFPGPVYAGYGKMIAERSYEPAAFKASLGLKDVGLALAAAEQVQVPMPLGDLVRGNLLDATAHDEGHMDLAVLGRVAERNAGRN